jgi:integrase
MAIHLLHLGLPVRDQQRSMRFYAPWFGFDPDGARRYPDGTVIVWSGSPGGSSSTPKRPACPKIRLHDVRHSYATAALAAGIPAKVVSERLGHANIAITMDTYSHVLPGLDAVNGTTVVQRTRTTFVEPGSLGTSSTEG